MNKFQLQVKKELDAIKSIGINVPSRAYDLITDPLNWKLFDVQTADLSRSETADLLIQLALAYEEVY